MKPSRVRKRYGIPLPKGVVYVGRPTRWGNPFRVGMFKGYTNADAVRDYKLWIDRDLGMRSADNAFGPPPTRAEIRKHLGGKPLACWCKPTDKCHADVLIRIANPRRRR